MGSHGHIELIDVQPFLERVCEGMQVGELLHGESFSLHDAMVAIEIGDPKMDVGLRRGDGRSAAELIAAGTAPADLPLRTQLAVMDRLLCMEATWQGGIMLSQTVFTSLYVLDPERLRESAPALHAGCVGVRSACTLLHDAGMSGQVVDDEDMMLHVFGFRLDVPGRQAVGAATATLGAALEGLVAGAAGEDASALVLRLRFRLKLLQLLNLMHPASDDSIAEVPALCSLACRLLDAMEAAPLPEEELTAAPGFAPEVHRRAMGLAPPRPVAVAPFAAAVGRWRATLRALGDACGWLAGCGSWGELRSRLVDFAAAPENLPLARSLLHRAIVGPLRSAEAAAAGAAAKAAGGLSDGSGAGGAPVPRWCPSQAMIAAEFGWVPDAAPPGPDAALFLEQCAIAAQGLVHTLCLNRCRQRRRLRRLLEDWRNMTDHAFNVEVSPEARRWFQEAGWRWEPEDGEGAPLPGPVTAWVEREAAAAAAAHLMLGFQLDLYAPHEFTAVYWYCDYLIGAGQSAGEELHGMRPPPAAVAAPPPTAAKGKGGKGKAARRAAPPAPSPEAVAAEERAAVASLAARVDRQMCQGVMRMALGLTWLGLVPTPPAPFNSARERFTQRFGCLEQLPRPPPLSFEDLVRSTAAGDAEAARVLLAAYEALAGAQNAAAVLEQGPLAARLPAGAGRHLAGVKRAAAQNMMALKLLVSSVTGPGAAEVPPFAAGWDWKAAVQHSGTAFFPAVVLKSAKAPKS